MLPNVKLTNLAEVSRAWAERLKRSTHAGMGAPRTLVGLAMGEGGPHEGFEQRVRKKGLRFELGVELYADKPGVIGHFDHLHQVPVG